MRSVGLKSHQPLTLKDGAWSPKYVIYIIKMFLEQAQHQTAMPICDAKCLGMCIVLTHLSK